MNNLILITSIIKTPEIPLSYAPRSVFNHEQRFLHTQKTIESVKKRIPNSKIFLVECSDLSCEENEYFAQNCDYVLNLYNHENVRNNIHSQSKSLCEGTMTFCALEFIINKNIQFDNLIKISGRYWLSERFNYDLFNNNHLVIKFIDNDINNVFTALYKLPKIYIENLKNFLLISFPKMYNFIGYENLFGEFIKNVSDCKIINLNPIGLDGYVSVSGEYYSG